jgi:hypothetical protein
MRATSFDVHVAGSNAAAPSTGLGHTMTCETKYVDPNARVCPFDEAL